MRFLIFSTVSFQFGNSILAGAVRSGNLNLVRMLLDKHADVNVKDQVMKCRSCFLFKK